MFKSGDILLCIDSFHKGEGPFLVKFLNDVPLKLYNRNVIGWEVLILTDKSPKGVFKEPPEHYLGHVNATYASLYFRPEVKVEFFNLDYLPKSEYPESCLE